MRMSNRINQSNLELWLVPLLQRRELLESRLSDASNSIERRNELLACQVDNNRKLAKVQGLLSKVYGVEV